MAQYKNIKITYFGILMKLWGKKMKDAGARSLEYSGGKVKLTLSTQQYIHQGHL